MSRVSREISLKSGQLLRRTKKKRWSTMDFCSRRSRFSPGELGYRRTKKKSGLRWIFLAVEGVLLPGNGVIGFRPTK